ncbi:MAG: single-stranded DNA-binding protein [Faecalibacterium prausnitzii]
MQFSGRLAADPELRTTQSGISVTSFRMAIDRSKADEDGNRHGLDWLSFTAWRNTAEFICKYFQQGQPDGGGKPLPDPANIRTRTAKTVLRTEFIVDKAHFCGPKQSNRQEPVDDGGTNPPPSTYRNPAAPADGIFHSEPAAAVAGRRSRPGSSVQPSYSQGNPDDFSEIDDTEDLPF